MKAPSHDMGFQVLLLQASDEQRGPMLFGESIERAREAVPPFLVGEDFPDIYLEHPLIGDPFLDVTMLLGELEPGTRVESPAAGDHGAMLDWYAQARRDHPDIACGFEIDTKEATLPAAAVHFQPRTHTELVRPFCDTIGEPARADLYLDLANRMPDGWPLSFFGMFRGRPGFPLRVCGYLNPAEKDACAKDPNRLDAAFSAVGFSDYDDAMLEQVSALMGAAPGTVDFQFDIFPDGHIGPVFAIDVQFGIEQPKAVLATFESGAGARVMSLLESWNVADGRWKQAIRSAFARSIPVELEDGRLGRYAFTLMPAWLKARWSKGALQPSKLYHLAHTGIIDDTEA